MATILLIIFSSFFGYLGAMATGHFFFERQYLDVLKKKLTAIEDSQRITESRIDELWHVTECLEKRVDGAWDNPFGEPIRRSDDCDNWKPSITPQLLWDIDTPDYDYILKEKK